MVSKDEQVIQMKKILIKNLNYYLDKKGINQTDMARILNIPETTVSNWMKGETYPRPDKLQLVADYFEIRRSDLTEERIPSNVIPIQPNFVKVPVLGVIACGEPILAEQNHTGFRYELSDTLPSGNLFYLQAKGDSMEPTIPNGSYVLIREQPEVEYGEIAAVLVNGDTEMTLKRVKRQSNTVFLMADNQSYEPYVITEENPARIIGKAIRYTQDL